MAIIKKRTREEHDQANMLEPLDVVCVSYELFLLIYEEVLKEVGKRIRRLSREGILEAIRKVESDRHPEIRKFCQYGKKIGVQEDLLDFCLRHSAARSMFCSTLKGSIEVKISVSMIFPNDRSAHVNLFLPIQGEVRFVNQVILNLGFSENILNGGSLKLSIPIEREIGEAELENGERQRGTNKFFYLK